MRLQHLPRGLRLERRAAGERPEHRAAETVEIGARITSRPPTGDHLRGHERGRPLQRMAGT